MHYVFYERRISAKLAIVTHELLRRLYREHTPYAVCRMIKRYPTRMQQLVIQPGHRAFMRPIKRITQHRMTQRRHMHAYLMRSPCAQPRFNQRCAVQLRQHAIVRLRLSPTGYYRHALAVSRMTAYRRINVAFVLLQPALKQFPGGGNQL